VRQQVLDGGQGSRRIAQVDAQRRAAVLAAQVDLSALLDQLLDQRGVALLGGVDQRGLALGVDSVERGAGGEQLLDLGVVAAGDRLGQVRLGRRVGGQGPGRAEPGRKQAESGHAGRTRQAGHDPPLVRAPRRGPPAGPKP
jgi:hypothetical protein